MLALAVVLVCVALGYALLAPPPPRELRIAIGLSADSAVTKVARDVTLHAPEALDHRLATVWAPLAWPRHIFARRRDAAHVRAYPAQQRSATPEAATKASGAVS